MVRARRAADRAAPWAADRRPTTLQAREASWNEHAALVDLIVAGDADGAQQLAHHHLTSHDDLAHSFSLDAIVSADTVRDVRD